MGIKVSVNASGNLVIESPHQNAENSRAIVERADMHDLFVAVREALYERDRLVYGTGFARRRPDGSLEHIPAADVLVFPNRKRSEP